MPQQDSFKPWTCGPSSWEVEGPPATCLGPMSLPWAGGMGERGGERGDTEVWQSWGEDGLSQEVGHLPLSSPLVRAAPGWGRGGPKDLSNLLLNWTGP